MCGAGSAGVGVSTVIKDAMIAAGLTEEEARSRFYVLEKEGLLAKQGMSSEDYDALAPEQQVLAESFDVPTAKRGDSLLEVIKYAKPTMLIGASTVAGLFTEEVVKAFHEGCGGKPIIMPLSNPTSKCEVSASDAYAWTNGECVFASGSPFDPVEYEGKKYYPSQCNNMFVFPGLGLGASVAEARVVTDAMLRAASEACANSVNVEEMARGQVFPSVDRIRDVSLDVAVATVESALRDGLATREELLRPGVDVRAFVEAKSYFPAYVPVVTDPGFFDN